MKSTLVIALFSILALTSCGLLKEKEPEVSIEPKHMPVGRVEKVNTSAGYVFIRRYGALRVGDNDVLEARGETDGVLRSANLFATGEKLGEHVAADIRSGEVQVGDAVFIRRIKPEEEAQKALESF